MNGHGHVVPNPNGVKARCGGPAICSVCARELASLAGKVGGEQVLALADEALVKASEAIELARSAIKKARGLT